MVEISERPLDAEERAAIAALIGQLPHPWRTAGAYVGIIVLAALVAALMGLAMWWIIGAGWSEMVTGTVAIIPGSILLLAMMTMAYVGANTIPAVQQTRRQRLFEEERQGPRRALLEKGRVPCTRVEATEVIEIVLDEDVASIYLFSLADGRSFYVENEALVEGPWPNAAFEIAREEVGDLLIWERVVATGTALAPAMRIEDPWCFDGFDGFVHRGEGCDAFVEGVYNEGADALLHRLLGKRVAGDGI